VLSVKIALKRDLSGLGSIEDRARGATFVVTWSQGQVEAHIVERRQRRFAARSLGGVPVARPQPRHTAMGYTLGEAARATGLNKSSILKALKTGAFLLTAAWTQDEILSMLQMA